ncbi:MAG: hypothetical protein LUD27_02940 [Clostridia bacterium]|nr:hypothetical protein [Clostridia bacterium]
MRKKILKILYNHLHRVIALAVFVVICIAVFLSTGLNAAVAYADTYVGENDYDSTAVLDDLSGSTINGKEFSVTDYAFTSNEGLQVLTFTEYCYSYYSNQQDNYALYVYVWNPQGLSIVSNSTLNQISIRFGDDASRNYDKYDLYFCNCSTGDCQGLFYKFKVYLTSEDKEEIFETLNSLQRVYSVSEIELKLNGGTNATSYYVSTKYTYTGFAAYYGSNNTSESTLAIAQEQEDTLTLNCGYTYYRPDGTNGTDNYTQDNLSSVYFAVPNSYLEKYGYLCGLSAEWTEAMLYPMLVTNCSDAYESIYNNYLGADVSELCETDDNFAYSFLGNISNDDYSRFFVYGMNEDSKIYDVDWYEVLGISTGGLLSILLYSSNLFYSLPDDVTSYDDYLSKLYSVLKDEDYTGNSNEECISSSQLLAELKRASKAGYEDDYEIIGETYASYLFESYKDVEFKVDMRDGYDGSDNAYLDLTNQTISYDNWWKKLWNDYTTTSNDFEGIPALQALTDEDFNTSNTDSANAQALYVSESDYSDLKSYYDEWNAKTTYTDAGGTTYDTDGYTVYLCRFDKGAYVSQDAVLLEKKSSSLYDWKPNTDYNSYFFQETVYLDFDIIDVTFTNGKTDTTIGVVMSPIDIVYASTSPVYTSSGTGCESFDDVVTLVLGALLLIVLLIIFAPLLPYIVKAVVWIIMLPFKLINAIIKAFKKPKGK